MDHVLEDLPYFDRRTLLSRTRIYGGQNPIWYALTAYEFNTSNKIIRISELTS
jgi:hypothetical protein